MNEVEVAVIAEEVEAEIIRSRLETEGIPVRIAPKSQIGVPASWSPRGLGFAIGSFSVRVAAQHAKDARRIIGEPEAPPEAGPPRPSAIRIIATILLIGFLLSTLVPLAQVLGH